MVPTEDSAHPMGEELSWNGIQRSPILSTGLYTPPLTSHGVCAASGLVLYLRYRVEGY